MGRVPASKAQVFLWSSSALCLLSMIARHHLLQRHSLRPTPLVPGTVPWRPENCHFFEPNCHAVDVPRTFRSKIVCCLDDLVRETKVAIFRANSLAISFLPQYLPKKSGWKFTITVITINSHPLSHIITWFYISKWMGLKFCKRLNLNDETWRGGLQLHGGKPTCQGHG